MRILVVGSGAREHALGWKLKKDSPAAQIFFSPGNGGTSQVGENIPTNGPMAKSAQKLRPGLVVIGPEAPLAEGLADELSGLGLKPFGPSRAAAQLEASKIFAKEFCRRHQLPTAGFAAFDTISEALNYLQSVTWPQVIKADGLAQGKGVVIAASFKEAQEALGRMMQEGAYGGAGRRVVIEEFLSGEELSVLAFCDGSHAVFLPAARDYKRLADGDRGPNTGGMGCLAPAPLAMDRRFWEMLEEMIVRPFLRGLQAEGLAYRGVIYFGLMQTARGPKILEFNVRFGDPETQVLMPLLKAPLVELMEATSEGLLGKFSKNFLLDALAQEPKSCIGVTLASAGYPEQPVTGSVIQGLPASMPAGVEVFHAGTALKGREWVTSGGRVLSVVGCGRQGLEARELAYQMVKHIHFEGMQYRKDIGA